ncbi:hypothetical protein BGW80DRAFT_1340561, partial [Lactifluus volemus]
TTRRPAPRSKHRSIEADKRERVQKTAQEKALREGATAAPFVAAPASAAPAITSDCRCGA